MTTNADPSGSVPKSVRGEPLETESGVEVPAQQTTGALNVDGSGEWPHPLTPPREPAPGAAGAEDGDVAAGDTPGAAERDSSPASEYEPQRVPVNMYETNEALVIVAPLPGVMPDDVEVTIDGRQLTIRAAMRAPAETKDYRRHEWHYGPYERTVDVPDGYGGEAGASFGNGQLALRLRRGSPSGEKIVVRPTD